VTDKVCLGSGVIFCGIRRHPLCLTDPAVNYDDSPTGMEEVDVEELTNETVTEIQRPRQGKPTVQGPNGYIDPHIPPGFGEEYHGIFAMYGIEIID